MIQPGVSLRRSAWPGRMPALQCAEPEWAGHEPGRKRDLPGRDQSQCRMAGSNDAERRLQGSVFVQLSGGLGPMAALDTRRGVSTPPMPAWDRCGGSTPMASRPMLLTPPGRLSTNLLPSAARTGRVVHHASASGQILRATTATAGKPMYRTRRSRSSPQITRTSMADELMWRAVAGAAVGRSRRNARARRFVRANGAMVERHRAAANAAAAERGRLSSSHLRREVSDLSKAALRPADATVEDYRKLQKRLGIRRHVVVQPSTYGTDNRCLVDSLQAFGPEAQGIAVVDTSVTDAELETLNKAGVRGIRFIVSVPGSVPLDMLEPLSARVNGPAGTFRSSWTAMQSCRMRLC